MQIQHCGLKFSSRIHWCTRLLPVDPQKEFYPGSLKLLLHVLHPPRDHPAPAPLFVTRLLPFWRWSPRVNVKPSPPSADASAPVSIPPVSIPPSCQQQRMQRRSTSPTLQGAIFWLEDQQCSCIDDSTMYQVMYMHGMEGSRSITRMYMHAYVNTIPPSATTEGSKPVWHPLPDSQDISGLHVVL